MSEGNEPIVIDNGSGMMKAGYAGDEAPRAVFPAVVGHNMFDRGAPGASWKEAYVGDEACKRASIVTLRYPLRRGVVKDWDDMEKVWRWTFEKELVVDPSEHPVLLTEHRSLHKEQREKAMQIMFETFSVPSFFTARPSVLALYAEGITTGVVVDCGEGRTDICCSYDGSPLIETESRVPLGGRDITIYFQELLGKRAGCDFATSARTEVINGIKESCGYVALDFDDEIRKAKNTSECNMDHMLSDGSVINIGDERFRCTELLFKPQVKDYQFDGVHRTMVSSINKCDDSDLEKEMYANIVLCGGSTMLKGFPERIEKEMIRFAPAGTKVHVIASPHRKYGAWVGGSILGYLATFPEMVITRKEYDEEGVEIVHRKCI